jgi:hypothetical protein
VNCSVIKYTIIYQMIANTAIAMAPSMSSYFHLFVGANVVLSYMALAS